MNLLLTGCAGFIGYHTALALIKRGDTVLGLDVINDYYDPELKYARLAELGIRREDIEYGRSATSRKYPNFRFIKLALEDSAEMASLFARERFDAVCHLAAQAGVRYSIENPMAYMQSNIVGFLNILEGCRHHPVKHLVYASSSSVYGLNTSYPFSVTDTVDHPVSLYAASKKSNELMAHTYSHLYGIPTSGLRFFTVYGPWGRPDMAYFSFTKDILAGRPIQVFNEGRMARSFTYIDDIVEGIVRLIDKPAAPNPDWDPARPDPASSPAPYRLYNIGSGDSVPLMDFITEIEKNLGITAQKEFLPMQAGDVVKTAADTVSLEEAVGYRPTIAVNTGVNRFIEWYRAYYGDQ
jgi:UDP-glucuronate 4-epimerase